MGKQTAQEKEVYYHRGSELRDPVSHGLRKNAQKDLQITGHANSRRFSYL